MNHGNSKPAKRFGITSHTEVIPKEAFQKVLASYLGHIMRSRDALIINDL